MTLMKAGALILLLVVVGASIAGLALGGLGIFTGSTGERGTVAPQTDVVAQETATPPIDASAVAPEAAAASKDTSALAPETAIPPVQASAPAQVETATFALG
jgi:hypothetical protein